MAESKPRPQERLLRSLRTFQETYAIPVTDVEIETPAAALSSLRDAAKAAPTAYADYLHEAVACYEAALYRAAILMVWAATVEHLYGVVGSHRNGVNEFETHNKSRYGAHRNYRTIKKKDDLSYLGEAQFIQLGEDAGLFNRNARNVLTDRLKLRNLCGHPTGYKPGREETVVFIESLTLNILSGSWLNWKSGSSTERDVKSP